MDAVVCHMHAAFGTGHFGHPRGVVSDLKRGLHLRSTAQKTSARTPRAAEVGSETGSGVPWTDLSPNAQHFDLSAEPTNVSAASNTTSAATMKGSLATNSGSIVTKSGFAPAP
eukprot:2855275-Rhodomonas_salina.1